ncbi:MAG: nucleotidyltransferase domain-containing protein [Candidatus Woesearchaeota archaeon]
MKQQLESIPVSEESESYVKVLYFFFDYPEKKVTLSELSEFLGMHKQTASKMVLKLKEEGFLNIETIGRVWQISCNPNHEFTVHKKIPYHLQLIYESGIVKEVRNLVPNAKNIILFGSYRKGDDVSTSDIDIAVEVLDDDKRIVELGVIKQLGYRKNVVVTVHFFNRKDVLVTLFNNIANGIILDGFLEVSP